MKKILLFGGIGLVAYLLLKNRKKGTQNTIIKEPVINLPEIKEPVINLPAVVLPTTKTTTTSDIKTPEKPVITPQKPIVQELCYKIP
jgi:hypothetical protein